MDASSAEDQRLVVRQAVLKSAQIVFDQTVIDCLVLNLSDSGTRLRVATAMPIPELVTLRFRGGMVFPARRRWSRGMEVGLSIDGTTTFNADAARLAWHICESIRACSMGESLRLLRARGFFDDVGLKAAAEQAEAAMQRLETLLAARASSPAEAHAPG